MSVLATALVLGTVPDQSGVIHGCYDKKTGLLRVIDSAGACMYEQGDSPSVEPDRTSGRSGCGRARRASPAAPGATGETGAQGAAGPQGPAGGARAITSTAASTDGRTHRLSSRLPHGVDVGNSRTLGASIRADRLSLSEYRPGRWASRRFRCVGPYGKPVDSLAGWQTPPNCRMWTSAATGDFGALAKLVSEWNPQPSGRRVPRTYSVPASAG
jgi:hypothetical protein